ncbi:MAG: chemotaxis protein CheA [Spirochaetales bacterium]|nr:chemotaxis protein CheA [Spirochaetales bacterium]MBR6199105.1 chemotaxis protein CheA [Spirochaetales bacterium]
MSDFIDDELLKDFFDEAYSLIEVIEDNVLVLEKDPTDREAIDALFRAAHTLKGGSATCQMDELAKFTHLMEDAMDEVRNGHVSITPDIVDVLLQALDVIKSMVETRSSGSVYSDDCSGVTAALQKIVDAGEGKSSSAPKKAAPKKEPAKPAPAPAAAKPKAANAVTLSEYDMLEISENNPDNLPLFKVDVAFDETNPMRTVGAVQVFTSLRDIGTVVKTYPDFEELYGDDFHPTVAYILATSSDADEIIKYATIPDTTTDIKVFPVLKESDADKDDAPAAETVQAAAPADDDIMALVKSITSEESNRSKADDVKTTESDFASINQEIKESKPAAAPESKAPAKATAPKNDSHAQSSVLRVESAKIDDLLNLVSEIVINKATFNQVGVIMGRSLDSFNEVTAKFKEKFKLFFPRIMALNNITDEKLLAKEKKLLQQDFNTLADIFDPIMAEYKNSVDRFKTTSQNLDRISSSLQESVMRVRMVQVKQTFSRFPRLVRDLSRSLGKQVELVMEGEETEIDKAMIDDLIDPLIHIIRNAVDHGLETPEEREKAGKKSPATVYLAAFSEGNLITIKVKDNGRGIDVDKVRRKAIEKGVIPADKSISDKDAYNLIFEPGFSTADKITSVSGRGVGLDVVKKNIEKLSGTIRVISELGVGSTFVIKLPLTLAIIQGLMVRVQDEIYAIPISSVMESIRVKNDEIKMIDNHEVINVREDVLSLLRLSRLFNFPKDEESDNNFVVIVGSNEKKIGLLVDTLIGEEDIVIKPLKDKYTSTPGIAGATILGDGTVSLILDVAQLIELGLKSGQVGDN